MYPREIELKDEKLAELLEKKGEIITKGRSISEQIEIIEKEMQEIDEKLVEAEKQVDISDIDADAQNVTDEFNKIKERMDEINKRVHARLIEQVPLELKDRYDDLKKNKDSLEEERNKMGIKAQKYNDKIVPIVQKLLKPHLENEFEDFSAVEAVNGIIKGKIFSHLEEWKEQFRKRNK